MCLPTCIILKSVFIFHHLIMQEPRYIRNEAAWPSLTFPGLVILNHRSMLELPEEFWKIKLNPTQDSDSGSLGYVWDPCLCWNALGSSGAWFWLRTTPMAQLSFLAPHLDSTLGFTACMSFTNICPALEGLGQVHMFFFSLGKWVVCFLPSLLDWSPVARQQCGSSKKPGEFAFRNCIFLKEPSIFPSLSHMKFDVGSTCPQTWIADEQRSLLCGWEFCFHITGHGNVFPEILLS